MNSGMEHTLKALRDAYRAAQIEEEKTPEEKAEDRRRFQSDVQILYKIWSYSSGCSKMCGDFLRCTHIGVGPVDLGKLGQLDFEAVEAMTRIMMLMHKSKIPMNGICDCLDEQQFKILLPGFDYNPN